MSAKQTGYLDFENGKMYYEVEGEGPNLVLGHAGFVDGRMWDSQWSEFTRCNRTIRFDLRGYGRSGPVQGPVSRRQDLYHLLQHLGIEQAALIGCSMSGEAVIDFTLEHPEMVTALIPVSTVPSGFEMQGEPPALLFEMIATLQQGDLKRASELQVRLWVDGTFRQPEQVDPVVRQKALEMNRIALANGNGQEQDSHPLQPPAVQRLRELQVPTLIIAGALDHPEILRAADLMAAEIPQAQKLILPDSAHVPNMEKPAEFNQAVLDFLETVR